MLGWDVGTFEFNCDRILALGYHSHAKLKLRTGGSVGQIGRTQCRRLPEGDGMFFDIAKKDSKNNVRLPVKYRYRSPIVFEFHTAGKRGASAYATVWLHHLVDNTDTAVNIPIWTTKQGARLTQNYVTEENLRAKEVTGLEDIEEVGRLHFRCQFKAGMDEDHERFVVDDDTRETFETWEACLAEGVRERRVSSELPQRVKDLHEQSLVESRDTLKQAGPEERQKWLAKDGQDWSGAFNEDPKAYMDSAGRKRAEPGADRPVHDPFDPSDDDDNIEGSYESDSSSEADLGVQDNTNTEGSAKNMSGAAENGQLQNGKSAKDEKAAEIANKKTEKRKNRGPLQWKPVRSLAFAKDEAKFTVKKMRNKLSGGLSGREPDVETEA